MDNSTSIRQRTTAYGSLRVNRSGHKVDGTSTCACGPGSILHHRSQTGGKLSFSQNRQKRAQIWFIDFMIGILIFASTLLIYFSVQEDTTDTRQVFMQDLVTRSKIATEDLMSKGYPEQWTMTNVSRIGLIGTDKKIDVAKVANLYDLTPQIVRSLLGMENAHYFLYFEYLNSTPISFGTANASGEVPEDDSLLVQTTRLAVLNTSVVRLRFFAWRIP